MRYTRISGTGLQLWQVRRLHAELYDQWPASAPSEVWTSEVTSYSLPTSRLGACLEGSLTVETNPGFLPAGFVATGSVIQPVKCLLKPFTRLVQVVATLWNGDEWVVYTGVLGRARAIEPRAFTVPLIGPDTLWMEEFADPKPNVVPTPAGKAPLAATPRLYSPTGTDGAAYWKVNLGDMNDNMKYQDWWRLALQADPMAEYGVGADLVFVAGSPLGTVTTRAVYPLDDRAENLMSTGAEVPPYLTHVRGVMAGQLPVERFRTGSVPPFTPRRTATYSGNTSTDVSESTIELTPAGGATLSVLGKQEYGALVQVGLPATLQGRVTAATLSASINIDAALTGQVAVVIKGEVLGSNGRSIVHDQPYLAVPGTFIYSVNADAKTLEGCNTLFLTVTLRGLSDDAQATATVGPEEAWVNTQEMFQTADWESVPPGLDYPVTTDEGWTFSTDGIHCGPLMVQGLPSGEQYASTVIRAEDAALWTEWRCGPLPYKTSPVTASGGWKT